MSAKTPRIKVLYIAGSGHSGSTILSNTLGQIDGFFCVGELMSLWISLVDDRIGHCGCGKRLRECPIWQEVFSEAYGGFAQIDPTGVARDINTLTRQGKLRGLLRAHPWKQMSALEESVNAIGELYKALHQVTGCRVIVDSSKNAVYGSLLASLPFIDLYLVHLVRDPRGYVYSMLHRVQGWSGPRSILERLRGELNTEPGPLRSLAMAGLTSLGWVSANLRTEWMWSRRALKARYRRVRYEDFIKQPQSIITDVIRFADEDIGTLPFTGERKVTLQATHFVGGNRLRSQEGEVQLRASTQWLSRMKRRNKDLATLMALPLLLRYGYPLCPDASRPKPLRPEK